MKVIAAWIMSLFSFLSPASPPVETKKPSQMIETAQVQTIQEEVEPVSATCPEAPKPACPVAVKEPGYPRIASIVYEDAQQSIQPVLITDGAGTKEMENAFETFKNALSKELRAAIREPKTLKMEPEMRVIGEAFADGINASAIRDKIGLFGDDIQIIVYTDFPFSRMNHRDPTGIYFRSQYQTLTQQDRQQLFSAQTEADAIFWISYLHL